MNRLLSAVFVLATFCSPLQASTPAQDHADIRQVVETFRTSLINKNPERFMTVFYSNAIPWIGVTTDQSLARMKAAKTDPGGPDPVKFFADSNPKDFIEAMSTSKDALEETFDNIRIDTDGDIAQIWFDFSFKVNGYKTNWGKEAWQLVRAADGWKINSVIWSIEANPIQPRRTKEPKP